jgi:hypothetical protein
LLLFSSDLHAKLFRPQKLFGPSITNNYFEQKCLDSLIQIVPINQKQDKVLVSRWVRQSNTGDLRRQEIRNGLEQAAAAGGGGGGGGGGHLSPTCMCINFMH